MTNARGRMIRHHSMRHTLVGHHTGVSRLKRVQFVDLAWQPQSEGTFELRKHSGHRLGKLESLISTADRNADESSIKRYALNF